MGWRNLGFIVVCLCGLGFLASHLVPRDLPRPDALQVALSPADSNLQELVAKLDDQFQQSWAAANVVPTATVDEWTVYRRLSLALTGTIPSLEEIRWLQGVPSEQRLGAWLNRLLSDRRFSDYLAERLARAYVGTEDGPFLVYRRRRFVTWLSDQIHDGRRYDDLVRELISGTGLWTDSPAVNFLTVTNDVNGDEQPDEQRLAARTAPLSWASAWIVSNAMTITSAAIGSSGTFSSWPPTTPMRRPHCWVSATVRRIMSFNIWASRNWKRYRRASRLSRIWHRPTERAESNWRTG